MCILYIINIYQEVEDRHMKRWFIGIGSVILLALTAVAATILYVGSTDDIVRVADTFKPAEDWQLAAEQVEPPRIVCMSVCPYLIRSWVVPETIAPADVRRFIGDEAMVPDEREAACFEKSKERAGEGCRVDGIRGDYEYRILVARLAGQPRLNLYVQEDGFVGG